MDKKGEISCTHDVAQAASARARIDTYLLLGKDYPDCHVVMEFKQFFGLFGISALRDNLKSLNLYRENAAKIREQIERFTKSTRIELREFLD